MSFVVYILQNTQGKRYTGHTDNLERRIFEHNNGLTGFTTNIGGPWKLIYKEENIKTRSEAMKREEFFKTGKGRESLKIILQD